MIKDLNGADGLATLRADVCIVGAGIAGLLLASRLRTHNLRVAVIESGPAEQKPGPDPLNRVVGRGQIYRGAIDGRSRGLGGTSTRWGGQLVPLGAEAFTERPYIGMAAWPVSEAELAQHLPSVEKLFGVDDGAYDEQFIKACGAEGLLTASDPDIQPSFSKAPAFKLRNIATLLGDLLRSDPSIEVVLNATVTAFETDRESGRIKRVTASSPQGRTLHVDANFFVLAPGAIEATRLLLALDAANGGRVFEECGALGRYFHDHVSLPAAELVPADRNRLNRTFAHRFAGATLRHTRLNLSAEAQAAERVACVFGHVGMVTPENSPFNALRNFLLSRQKSGDALDTKLLINLLKEFPYLAAVGWWRFVHRQLRWPNEAKLHLHIVVEQVPQPDSTVTLANERDTFGVPLAAIDWKRSEADNRAVVSYAERFEAFWRRQNLDRLAELKWTISRNAMAAGDFENDSGADVYHPAGSTRMGANGRDAVLDANLRTFPVKNLWVASSSAFPSMTNANPTLTLMLLALRLGDHLASQPR